MKLGKKVYVAGAITGYVKETEKWRAEWKKKLEEAGFSVFDPYLDASQENGSGLVATIVHRDINRILTSDIILVYGDRPSWGTAMEIVYARMFRNWVFTIYSKGDIPIWLQYHSDKIFKSLDEFLDWVKEDEQGKRED